MPASPSEGVHKWRRKRGPKTTKRHRADDDEDDDDEDDDNNINCNNQDDNDEDLHPNPNPNYNPNPNPRISNPQIMEVVSGSSVRISTFPSAVKHAITRPPPLSSAATALENISYGQLQVLSAVPSDSAALVSSSSDRETSVVISPPQIMEGKGVLKTFWNSLHLLPLHADWFQPTSVHRLERQVVPHFFSSANKSPQQHTPDKYLDSRNLIIAKYLQNPQKRLSLDDCQPPPFALDHHDLSRIFRFLDHWGIINYCAPPSPHHPSWSLHSYLREDPNGEVHVPSPTLKSIDTLITFDKPKCSFKPAALHNSNDDYLTDLDSRIRERLSENQCNYCSRPLLLVYYQSVKEADTLLCPDCFHEGRLVIGHSSIDFIKVDSAVEYANQDGESWTDQETLLLLEALELYNDSWNDIADHVRTKSKSQCILHFLRLPMEDGLLENLEVPSSGTPPNGSNKADHDRVYPTTNGVSTGHHVQGSDFENKFPFAKSGNPVMALVAFLASAVGPRIAAACAHACLAALSEDEISPQGNRVDSDDGPVESRNSSQQKEETLAAEVSRIPNNVNAEESLPSEKVKTAAKAGLAAAALKAKLFADHEEREIQRLSANIINHQLKRLELKLKQFAEVETLLMKECEQVEKTRQRLAGERGRAIASRFGSSGVGSPVNLSGIAPQAQVVNNNMGSSSRPGALSTSASQPSVSGYANQMSHSQMPLLARQQMYSFGPRLPLSAIHPSSSGSMMFGGQGSSQSPLSHSVLRPVPGTSSGMG